MPHDAMPLRSARLLAGALCLALVGCEIASPSQDLTGRWGGAGAELVAGATTTTLELACVEGEFVTRPELTHGRFEAPVRLQSLNYDVTVVAEGEVSGDLLRLTLRFPDDPETFLLRLGRGGEFGDRICAA
jgi:hypothetical protein